MRKERKKSLCQKITEVIINPSERKVNFMKVIVKCQRKNYTSEVHDVFTKEVDQGYISMFLVNDNDGRFHWVDFEQCVLSEKLENENLKEEYCDLCYSCMNRIRGCNLLYPSKSICVIYDAANRLHWEKV